LLFGAGFKIYIVVYEGKKTRPKKGLIHLENGHELGLPGILFLSVQFEKCWPLLHLRRPCQRIILCTLHVLKMQAHTDGKVLLHAGAVNKSGAGCAQLGAREREELLVLLSSKTAPRAACACGTSPNK